MIVYMPYSKRYDWSEIQKYYDTGRTYRDCLDKFGCTSGAWHKAMLRGDIKTRSLLKPFDEVLVENSTYSRGNLKARLLKYNLVDNICAICRCEPMHNGRALVLVLDHKNGIHNDNRIENLRMLCPNCNSQTDTFSGRNKKYK